MSTTATSTGRALGRSAFGILVGLVLVTGIRLLRIPHRVADSREEGQTG